MAWSAASRTSPTTSARSARSAGPHEVRGRRSAPRQADLCIMSAMHTSRFAVAVAAALFVAPAIAHGHFKLVEPASWLVENDRGDPQKTGPCGGANTDWGKPRFAINKGTGGREAAATEEE